MRFIPLVLENNVKNGFKKAYSVGGENILLVKNDEKIHAVENSCGHFGMPLEAGSVDKGTIRCPSHGVRFDLNSGNVLNTLYDDCHAIKVFKVSIHDGWVGIEI